MSLRTVTVSTLVIVQDRGRRGRAHQGVARSGAWDTGSAQLGNRLVGNAPDAAVLEVLLGGFEVVALSDAVVAVTGATVDVSINHAAVGQNMALFLPAGSRLRLARASVGLRITVAVRGGINAAPVLGSRSYDTLGRIGPPPLQVGHLIDLGSHDQSLAPAWFEQVPDRSSTVASSLPIEIGVTLGPRQDWLLAGGLETFVNTAWTVASSSDRTGVRLDGPPIARRSGELSSEAMIPGAIQLPMSGQPIILGPDCGTTGGYPVIAVVRRTHFDRVGQLRPGDHIRFRPVRT
jgi:biotin-dependent carboxylase-like uncharacterized protein